MRVDVIASYEEFSRLRLNWDAVYTRDPEAHFFLSWPWLSEWLNGGDNNWYILAAAPDKTTSVYVAFFPLRTRVKMGKGGSFVEELSPAGRGMADYTGLLTLPEFEDSAIAAFADHLKSSHWSALKLEFLRHSQERVALLLEKFSGKAFVIQEVPTVNEKDGIDNAICPQTSLPDDWDSYLGMLGSNTRQKMRRFLRKVDEGEEYSISVATSETVERDVDLLLQFWSVKWQERKSQHIPRLVRTNRWVFLRSFANGALFMPVLWQKDKPLGVLATYKDEDKRSLLFYMGARDETFRGPVAPGVLLHAFSLRWAIEHGYRQYDFLRGNEEYKYMFGVEEVVLRNLTIATKDGLNLGHKLNPHWVDGVLTETMKLHKSGRIAEAERGYLQVLEAEPTSVKAQYSYAQLLSRKGEHLKAARILRRLVKQRPAARNAWFRLGHSLEAGKRYKDAADAYQEVVKLAPSDSDGYVRLGRALHQLGNTKEASVAFETAAELRPSAGARTH